MALSFHRDTVTVIRPSYRIDRGRRIAVWSPPASQTVARGCRVQPMHGEEILFSGSASTEGGTARDARVTRWKLFAPTQVALNARDRVRFGGVVYEVDGPPQRWGSPTGLLRHTEAWLKIVEG
jgi:hypothetical protein